MWDLREYIKQTDISITPVTGEETENGAEEMGKEGMRIPRRVSPQNPEVPGQDEHREMDTWHGGNSETNAVASQPALDTSRQWDENVYSSE